MFDTSSLVETVMNFIDVLLDMGYNTFLRPILDTAFNTVAGFFLGDNTLFTENTFLSLLILGTLGLSISIVFYRNWSI